MNKQGSRYGKKKTLGAGECYEKDKVGAMGVCLGWCWGRLSEDGKSASKHGGWEGGSHIWTGGKNISIGRKRKGRITDGPRPMHLEISRGETTERNEIREADRGHSKGLRRPCTGIWIYSTLSAEPSEGCQ